MGILAGWIIAAAMLWYFAFHWWGRYQYKTFPVAQRILSPLRLPFRHAPTIKTNYTRKPYCCKEG